jgi:hypothetical protein
VQKLRAMLIAQVSKCLADRRPEHPPEFAPGPSEAKYFEVFFQAQVPALLAGPTLSVQLDR